MDDSEIDVVTRQSSKRMNKLKFDTSLVVFLNTCNKRSTTTGIRSSDDTATIKQLRRTVSNDRRVMCSHLSMDINVIRIAVNE